MYIHDTATVEAGARIGEGCKVWRFAHVMSGAVLGEGVMLGQGVFVGPRVRIGARSRIQNFANLPEGVELGESVFVGPHVSFTNVKYPRAEYRADHYGVTRVGRGASIGANVTVVCGVSLGEYCMVGAGAVVTRDVPPHALVYGCPASQQGWVGVAGVPLAPDAAGYVCPKTGDRYRLDDGTMSKAPEP